MAKAKSQTLALIILLCIASLPALATTGAREKEDEFPLFEFQNVSVSPAFHLSSRPAEVRLRRVVMNPRLTSRARPAVGDRLTIPGFDGRRMNVVVSRVRFDINGVRTIVTKPETDRGAALIITEDRGRWYAAFHGEDAGRQSIVRWDARSGGHLLIDFDSDLEPDLDDGPVLLSPIGASRIPAVAAIDDSTMIDVMIVYTPRARDEAAARFGSIGNAIAQAVAVGQECFDVSLTGLSLNLVHSAEVSFSEVPENSNANLANLRDPLDGVMDEVHAWRDLYGADLVQMFSLQSDYGGLGFLLREINGSPQYGFSLVRVQQATGTTLIHEMGHNMGCHHRKDQPQSPGTGIFPYSSGWRWIGSDGVRYASVMSYTDAWDGNPVLRSYHFSNPVVLHLGAATGDAEQADNARTLRETAAAVASYRPFRTGSVSVIIQPRAARDLRAAWRVDGSPWHGSGGIVTDLRLGAYALELKKVKGYEAPEGLSARILPGQKTVLTALYNAIPTVDSITPDVGSGQSAVFEIVFSDADGGGDLQVCEFLIAGKKSPTKNALYLRYERAGKRLYLRDNRDRTWGEGQKPGRAGAELSNRQGIVDVAGVGIVETDGSLILRIPIVFSARFIGVHDLLGGAVDAGDAASGLVKAGNWIVTR